MNFALLVANLPSVYHQLALHAPTKLAKPRFAAAIKRTITRLLGRA